MVSGCGCWWRALVLLGLASPCGALRFTGAAAPSEEAHASCKDWSPGGLQRYVRPKGALALGGETWKDRAAKFPLTVESIRNATYPLGYQGDRRRWAAVVKKVFSGAPVQIAVFGAHCNWADNLRDYFHRLNLTAVEVTRFDHNGTTSAYPLTEKLLLNPKVQAADLVLVDYSVNDAMHTHTGDYGAKDYNQLVEELLALPQEPAVVDIEMWHVLGMRPQVEWTTCTRSLGELVHQNALKHSLPVITIFDATCHSGENFWDGGIFCHWNGCCYDTIARVVLGAFAVERDSACTALAAHHGGHPGRGAAKRHAGRRASKTRA